MRGVVERGIPRLTISDSRDDRLRPLDVSSFLGYVHVMRAAARSGNLNILLRETVHATRESPFLCEGD